MSQPLNNDPILRSIACELDNCYSNLDNTLIVNEKATSQQQQKTNSFEFQLESFLTRPKSCKGLFPPHVQERRYQAITVQERLVIVSIKPIIALDKAQNRKNEEEQTSSGMKGEDGNSTLVAGLEVLEYLLYPKLKEPSNEDSHAENSFVERILYIAKVDTSGCWPLPGINSRGLQSPTHALVKGYLKGMRAIDSTSTCSPPSQYLTNTAPSAEQLSSLTIAPGLNTVTDDKTPQENKENKESTEQPRISRYSVQKTSLYIFARAQPQYLFAKSAKNPGKRPLNDRSLVRWWKNIATSVYSVSPPSDDPLNQDNSQETKLQGYWYIPGVDTEREALRTIQASLAIPDSLEKRFNWTYGYPDKDSKEMANATIPQFPDDPKSRIMRSPSGSGGRVNVRTFWELAAIGEECGAGKITGFFRITEERVPKLSVSNVEGGEEKDPQGLCNNDSSKSTNLPSCTDQAVSEPNRKLGKGTTSNYTKAINFLLDLDFSTLESANDSTRQWKNQVQLWTPQSESLNPDLVSWIQQQKVLVNLPIVEDPGHITTTVITPSTTQTLNVGLIKRKEPVVPAATVNVLGSSFIKRKTTVTDTSSSAVNTLSSSLIKRKTAETPTATTAQSSSPAAINLNPSLIKRKVVSTEIPKESTADSSPSQSLEKILDPSLIKKRRVDTY
ncbi:hypothetical protein BGZ76_001604 [Entomortierella beljakovae]|nr:hypothetical protein BGZ76_001604 [Entomortierella beljakovae]